MKHKAEVRGQGALWRYVLHARAVAPKKKREAEIKWKGRVTDVKGKIALLSNEKQHGRRASK